MNALANLLPHLLKDGRGRRFSSPEVEKFLMKGRLLFEDFGYALYLTDSEDIMRRYEMALRELHLV